MYTRCPHCMTVFMLAAEQLKAAHGNVRCGTCLESFDAIPHLSDGPAPLTSKPAGEHAEASAESSHRPMHAASARRSASKKLTSTLDAARAVASPHAAGAAHTDGAPALESGDGARAETEAMPASRELAGSDETLPEVLRADAEAFSASQAVRRRSVGYGIAALALLALLVGQYLFFMPEDAARRYPQFRGAIESICVHVGCVLAERRDPSRIRVLSRDVRVHPKLEGVMQIKATLTNAAPYRQPYPQVQFTLFNVNGQTIASRIFEPSEYMGRAVAASARLRPQTSFQLALDVLAPAEAAVSFEFQFL